MLKNVGRDGEIDDGPTFALHKRQRAQYVAGAGADNSMRSDQLPKYKYIQRRFKHLCGDRSIVVNRLKLSTALLDSDAVHLVL